jgi:hypothetical protein
VVDVEAEEEGDVEASSDDEQAAVFVSQPGAQSDDEVVAAMEVDKPQQVEPEVTPKKESKPKPKPKPKPDPEPELERDNLAESMDVVDVVEETTAANADDDDNDADYNPEAENAKMTLKQPRRERKAETCVESELKETKEAAPESVAEATAAEATKPQVPADPKQLEEERLEVERKADEKQKKKEEKKQQKILQKKEAKRKEKEERRAELQRLALAPPKESLPALSMRLQTALSTEGQSYSDAISTIKVMAEVVVSAKDLEENVNVVKVVRKVKKLEPNSSEGVEKVDEIKKLAAALFAQWKETASGQPSLSVSAAASV